MAGKFSNADFAKAKNFFDKGPTMAGGSGATGSGTGYTRNKPGSNRSIQDNPFVRARTSGSSTDRSSRPGSAMQSTSSSSDRARQRAPSVDTKYKQRSIGGPSIQSSRSTTSLYQNQVGISNQPVSTNSMPKTRKEERQSKTGFGSTLATSSNGGGGGASKVKAKLEMYSKYSNDETSSTLKSKTLDQRRPSTTVIQIDAKDRTGLRKNSLASSNSDITVKHDINPEVRSSTAPRVSVRKETLTTSTQPFMSQYSKQYDLEGEYSEESGIDLQYTKMQDGSDSFAMGEDDSLTTVGFGFLPNQVYKRAVKKGFEFSLMVVGESGLGKENIYLLDDIGQTLQVEAHKVTLEERGVKLNLTVVDTPGFGVAVDNSNCWEPIITYIDDQFEKYLEGETKVHREASIQDTRVHACLYFIAPTGHGLKPLDVEFMRKIHHKVNIIPVIGKSDCCTKSEITAFKEKVLNQLKEKEIETYGFPESELTQRDMWMREQMPFAVVGSNTVIETETGRIRGREYSWGTIDIENKDHCDFTPLRSLLLCHHMQDLRELTHVRHYEKYRSEKLSAIGVNHNNNSIHHISKAVPVLNGHHKMGSEGDSVGFEDIEDESFESGVYPGGYPDSIGSEGFSHRGKKSWVLKWKDGKLQFEQKYVTKPVLSFKNRMMSMSVAELRSKSTENFAGLREAVRTLTRTPKSRN